MRLPLRAILVLLSLAAWSESDAGQFVTDPANQTDTVYFRSSASLEFIEGSTTDLTGWFTFDPDNPSTPVDGILRVDLRTLRTGIDLRDEHMRDRHLHTDQFPFAYFSLDSVYGLPGEITPDSVFSADAAGQFYIHGVRRNLDAAIEVSRRRSSESDRLDIRVSFDLALDDYEIPRPRALFLKLAETIEVEVIFTALNNLESPEIILPDWELLP